MINVVFYIPHFLGTENVALIAGLGAASRLARDEADLLFMHMLTLKLRLIMRLRQVVKRSPQTHRR